MPQKDPALYNLSAHISFVDGLVAGIGQRFGDDPLAVSDLLILLPNRRAVRALRDAFLRAGGGRARLLPRIEPIGDVDEDDLLLTLPAAQTIGYQALPPPIPAAMRQMLLMDIIRRWHRARGETAPEAAQSAILAQALGQFLDHVQTEQLTFKDLDHLVPEEYAVHWQQTLEFLKILTEQWPDILARTGFCDGAVRRNRLLDGLRQKWIENPPSYPVIVAGSTGSIPATAALIKTVAHLPRGMVVLPGLDQDIDPESWAILNDSHPQATMKYLLDYMNAARDMVQPWLAPDLAPPPPLRQHLLREVMRPAETTDHWRALDIDLTTAGQREEIGITIISAPGQREEAGMIALMLRDALEEKNRTAALVTPDRQLARRVASELARWDIAIDDSAGTPLNNLPPGLFLRLTADMAGTGLAPVPLLSVLKHPLASGGQNPHDFRRMVRLLEENILRGIRPAAGTAGVARAIALWGRGRQNKHALADWWQDMVAIIQPFEQLMQQPELSFEALLVGHIEMVEKLSATDDETGDARLWRGDAGEEAAQLIEALYQAASYLPRVKPDSYPALLDVFMQGIVVRPKYGQHPRLNIWGPMEARLQQADLVILAGLNEESWPLAAPADPWMSRPMRKAFGLPSLERKIGLSAHDFIQAASAPAVVLSRAEKIDGTPTVKSRWLSRMETIAPSLFEGAGTSRWANWYQALDKPDHPYDKKVVTPPRPTPPLSARPRKMSVTRIEKWMQDPYSIYARYILRLPVLDPLDADPGAADKGTIIHKVLDSFMKDHPDHLPDEAYDRLLAKGRQEFEDYFDRPLVRTFWWPRFTRIAAWFIAQEQTRRRDSRTVATEIFGEHYIDSLPGGPFTLTATADRIDRLADGCYEIIDYKTGQSPTARKIHAGFAPQLPLEGVLAMAGSFKGIPAAPVSHLSYWTMSGGAAAGKITCFHAAGIKSWKMDVAAVITSALDGLKRLITTFDLPDTPYLNNPRPENMGYGDYDHLARTLEWQGNELDPDSLLTPHPKDKTP